MARGFKRKGEVFVARLDANERGVVAGLMEQTRVLLAPAERESTGDPFEDLVVGLGVSLAAEDQLETPDGPEERDPALDRLLPTAHRGDDQVAAEFRRLTEHDLRDRKATNLATAIVALGRPTGDRLELSRDEAQATMIALTDTRLLLGERLGLRTDEDAAGLEERLAGLDDDDPTLYAVSFYEFLTWLQESLAGALMGRGFFG
ncbi:MAG: DUF2017 domain-containing protein [Actinomycetota bacterium]|nr:DUF2017 domain-containing protein [Actinomycetota bacterium]